LFKKIEIKIDLPGNCIKEQEKRILVGSSWTALNKLKIEARWEIAHRY
jgi:hypothetical protein